MKDNKIIYEVDIGKVLILADSETNAKIGACNYVGSDMGIENLRVVSFPELDPEEDDAYDWEE